MNEIFDSLLNRAKKVDNEQLFENQLNFIGKKKQIKEEDLASKNKHTVFQKYEIESNTQGTFYVVELFRDETFTITQDDKVIASGIWSGTGVHTVDKSDAVGLCQMIFDLVGDATIEKPVDEDDDIEESKQIKEEVKITDDEIKQGYSKYVTLEKQAGRVPIDFDRYKNIVDSLLTWIGSQNKSTESK